MSAIRYHTCFMLACLFPVILFPVRLVSQDTLRVRLPGSNVFEDERLVSDLSRIVINRLVKIDDYMVLPVQSSTDTIDLIGLSEIDARMIPEGFSRSAAVFTSRNVIIATNDKPVRSLAELADAHVGVLASSLGEDRIRQETQFFESYTTIGRLVEDLMKGRIQYVLVEASVAKAILDHDGLKTKLYLVNENVFETHLGFFVRKTNTRLLAYLDEHIGTFRESEGSRDLDSRFVNIPKDSGPVILFWSILVGGIVIVTLVLVAWRRGWIRWLANSYSVQLSGLLMIRPSPTMRASTQDQQSNPGFKEKLAVFQMKYPSVDSKLEFQNSMIKIELRTRYKTRVGEKAFLDTFAQDLEDLISVFASERYVMELNVTGECSNMFELNRFVMTNNQGKVGLMVSNFKKRFFI